MFSWLPARWMAAGGFGTSCLLTSLAFIGFSGNDHGVQPIAYNHAKHIENGMSCVDCHTGVEVQAKATLPTLDICMTCHAAALSKSAEEEKIRTLAAAGQELRWVKLMRVPAHVYFSHRSHVALGKLACATCHGPMEKLTAPPVKPFRNLSMDACIDCHEKTRARTDCNDCHR